MIKDRPENLLKQPLHATLPVLPLAVEFDGLPNLVRLSLLDLGGIQPITVATANAAGGPLHDKPSDGEIAYHKERGSKFQLVSVVVSVFAARQQNGSVVGRPYAVSLMPGSKRGKVQQATIDLVSKLDPELMLRGDPAYAGYNPFTGAYGLYSTKLSMFLGTDARSGFLDEIGLVTDQYFLTDTYDTNEVCIPGTVLANPALEEKYRQHRIKLFYKAFSKVEPRRVWGAQSPIELFLIQELASRGLFPQIQMLILDNGTTHPSWYHLWHDLEFRNMPGLVTEADLYFPEKRIAVFCDSNKHHRGAKKQQKDAAINERLVALQVKPVRVPGKLIVDDVSAAADLVIAAL